MKSWRRLLVGRPGEKGCVYIFDDGVKCDNIVCVGERGDLGEPSDGIQQGRQDDCGSVDEWGVGGGGRSHRVL